MQKFNFAKKNTLLNTYYVLFYRCRCNLFLAFILLTKKEKNKADIILFCWLSIIGVHLFLFYLGIDNSYNNYPYLLGLNIPIPLLHGPLLFLYTSYITNQNKSWKFNLLHFIPFVLFFIFIIDFLSLPIDKKLMIYQNNGLGYEVLMVTSPNSTDR